MITFEEFRKKALFNPDVKEEYENLKIVFEIKKQLIKKRINSRRSSKKTQISSNDFDKIHKYFRI